MITGGRPGQDRARGPSALESRIHIYGRGDKEDLDAVAYPGFFYHWADSQQNFSDYWAIKANQKPAGP